MSWMMPSLWSALYFALLFEAVPRIIKVESWKFFHNQAKGKIVNTIASFELFYCFRREMNPLISQPFFDLPLIAVCLYDDLRIE